MLPWSTNIKIREGAGGARLVLTEVYILVSRAIGNLIVLTGKTRNEAPSGIEVDHKFPKPLDLRAAEATQTNVVFKAEAIRSVVADPLLFADEVTREMQMVGDSEVEIVVGKGRVAISSCTDQGVKTFHSE